MPSNQNQANLLPQWPKPRSALPLPICFLTRLAIGCRRFSPNVGPFASIFFTMDEAKLSQLVEHFLRTESGVPQLSEFLCRTLANTLRTEIDGQLARSSLRPLALPPTDSSSSLDFWLQENGDASNGFQLQEGKAQAIARQMAKSSVAYKEFRGRTLDLCLQQLHDLWHLRRPSGSAMEVFLWIE